MAGVLANLAPRPLAWLLRPFARPHWGASAGPSDAQTAACAEVLLSPSAARDRLTTGIFVGDEAQPAAKLDAALQAVIAADAILARLKGRDIADARAARDAGAISADEFGIVERAAQLTHQVITVDDFAPEDLSPRWNR
jgi:acyl-CoA dehydrogenase